MFREVESGGHGVDGGTDAPQIRAQVVLRELPVALLRGLVAGGADAHRNHSAIHPRGLGDAEVGEDVASIAVQEHVGRLDVEVENGCLVGGAQGGEQICHQSPDRLFLDAVLGARSRPSGFPTGSTPSRRRRSRLRWTSRRRAGCDRAAWRGGPRARASTDSPGSGVGVRPGSSPPPAREERRRARRPHRGSARRRPSRSRPCPSASSIGSGSARGAGCRRRAPGCRVARPGARSSCPSWRRPAASGSAPPPALRNRPVRSNSRFRCPRPTSARFSSIQGSSSGRTGAGLESNPRGCVSSLHFLPSRVSELLRNAGWPCPSPGCRVIEARQIS